MSDLKYALFELVQWLVITWLVFTVEREKRKP